MSALPHPQASTPAARRKAFFDFMVDGVLMALLFLVVLRVAVPGFQGWYHEDDFHNLRWAMEYRYEPWRALVDRHTLHDHVRPMTLMTIWFGTFVGDGEYWGQHLMLVLLHAAGVCGLVALGTALSGRRRAGLLAGIIVTSTWGWERLLDWNALMNTAGEVAFGLATLLAVHRGLKRPVWLAVGAVCVVIAGLYKEPGSVLYPVAAVAMAWGAWRRGESPRRMLLVCGFVLIGGLTFAFTWAEANLSRMDAVAMPLPQRVLIYLESHASGLVAAWPGDAGTGKLGGGLAGFPAVLVGMVLFRDLIGRPLLERRAARVVWLVGSLGLWFLIALRPTLVGNLLFPGVLLVLGRRWREPPVGLVLYVMSVCVMAPFNQGNEVQIMGGTYGLALYLGRGLDEALEHLGTEQRLIGWGAVGATLLTLGLATVRYARLPPDATWAIQRQTEHTLLGWGAAVRTLGVNYAQAMGMSITEQEVLPLVGIGQKEADPNMAATVSIDGKLLVMPPQGAIENVLIPNDVILGVEIPTLSQGQGTTEDSKKGPQGMSFDVASGWWALGVGTSMGGRMQLILQAMDNCGNTWQASQMESIPVPFNLTPFFLEPGCGPVKLSWVGEAESPDGLAFLASLQAPIVSMWHPIDIQRRLPVNRRTTEFAQ